MHSPVTRQKSRTAGLLQNNFISGFLAGPDRPQRCFWIVGTTDLLNFSIGEDSLQIARIRAFLLVLRTDQIHNIVPDVRQNTSPPCARAA